jgi:Transglutaminase-like superfamily
MPRSDLRRLGRRLLRALRMPPREILTTLHVAAVMVVVEMLIRWVPLPRLSRLLGLRVNLAPARPAVEQMRATELPARAGRQLRCTRRVADAWPFSKGPCLRRSLVVGHLLRHHDPAVRLGVAGSGDHLFAHAWVEIDDRPLESVAGFNVFQRTEATR